MHVQSRWWGLALVALMVALPLGACSSSPSTPGPAATVAVPAAPATEQHLDVAAFAALAAAPGTVVLDVRTPEEFAAGHLAGARNLDIRASDVDSRLAALDHGATYAVYCHSGNRSGQALLRMAAAGFTHASDLSGGITGLGGRRKAGHDGLTAPQSIIKECERGTGFYSV